MNAHLDMTVGRPWALAFALALRDGLGVPAVDPPKTGFGVANPEHSDQADAWWSWWDSLLATSSSNRGLAELNDVRTVDDLASFGSPKFGDTASLVPEAAAWAMRWASVPREMVHPSSRPSALIEGIVSAGFQTHSGRRKARRGLGRALPDDVVVAVVPVASEWAQVTRFGSILVSELVAADAELTQQYFTRNLWAS